MQAFETEGLVGSAAAPAVLSYLFHRIEGRLTGRPSLIIVDEGWLALDDTTFGAQLREWLKTLRKKNAAVVFATQSLADIETSAIAPAIIESCPTRISCPTSGRSSRRSARPIASSGSTIGRSRSSARRRPSATTTASRGAATACSSSASGRSPWLSPPPPRGLTRRRSPTPPRTAPTASPPPGCAMGAALGGGPPDGPLAVLILAGSPGGCRMKSRHRWLAVAASVLVIATRRRDRPGPDRGLRPKSYVQDVLTAARQLQQINNQIVSLQNQAQMLINEAQNLASLPTSTLDMLQSDSRAPSSC